MRKPPLQKTKESYGSKDKLIEEILSIIKRPADLSKEDLKKKLLAQSNKKLLTLLAREKATKERFGSREKLIDAIIKFDSSKNKKEDKHYRKHLNSLTVGQLLVLARHRQL